MPLVVLRLLEPAVTDGALSQDHGDGEAALTLSRGWRGWEEERRQASAHGVVVVVGG